MNYLSTVEFESKLFPGLKYKLRKMSSGRRSDFRIKTADIFLEIETRRLPLKDLLEKLKDASEEEKPVLEAEIMTSQTALWNELFVGKLYPAYIRWGVEEITGMEVDGQPVTLESIFSLLPEEAITEIGAKIDSVINMTFEEQMLFELPSTSSAQVDGPIPSTSAQTAA